MDEQLDTYNPGVAAMNKRIEDKIYSYQNEKTFSDKLLGADDIQAIRDIIKKQTLKRTELLELQYLLASKELKLYNFSEHERYIIMKYYVWIRSFISAAERLYDYIDDMNKPENSHLLDDDTRQLLINSERTLQHICKFNADLYLTICRSSLSVGATAFKELLMNRFEVSYNQPKPQVEQSKGWSLFRKKGDTTQ